MALAQALRQASISPLSLSLAALSLCDLAMLFCVNFTQEYGMLNL
jgi:hypothetical protein